EAGASSPLNKLRLFERYLSLPALPNGPRACGERGRMAPVLILAITAVMVATAFLSGIFGMAGGLILIGILLVLLPLPEAMALHAVTQMASNGWRGLLWWRHVRWRLVVIYLAGCALALGAWSLT